MSGPPATRVSAVPVLRLVVLAVLGVLILDRTPPPLVVAIPADGFRQSFLEGFLRLPPQRLQLGRIQRIASIVPGPISDRLDQRWRLADEFQQPVRQVHV